MKKGALNMVLTTLFILIIILIVTILLLFLMGKIEFSNLRETTSTKMKEYIKVIIWK